MTDSCANCGVTEDVERLTHGGEAVDLCGGCFTAFVSLLGPPPEPSVTIETETESFGDLYERVTEDDDRDPPAIGEPLNVADPLDW